MSRAAGDSGARSSARGGRVARFLRDLLSPRGTVRLLPPPPRTIEQAGKEILIRSVVAQFIGGPDSTLAEKAAWVASPEVVAYAARRGARAGAEVRASQPLPPPPNASGASRRPHRVGPFDGAIDV